MLSRQKRRVIWGQSVWMLLALIFVLVIDRSSLEFFFIISLIGFLLLVDISSPVFVRPTWRKRLLRIAVLGILIVSVMITIRIATIIATNLQ